MVQFSDLSAQLKNIIWKASYQKSEGYLRFASEEERTRYLRLQKLVNGKASQDIGKLFSLMSNNGTPEEILKLSQNKHPRDEEYKGLQHELRQRGLKAIRNGQCISIGFQVPRGISDAPQEVPLDMWRGANPWDGNDFTNGSLKVEHIRFFPAAWVQQVYEKYVLNSGETENVGTDKPENPKKPAKREPEKPIIPDVPEAKTKGRPSKRDVLWNAYTACDELELIDYSGSKKHTYNVVMAYLKENQPDEYADKRGLGEQTFLNTIREHFDDKVMNLKGK